MNNLQALVNGWGAEWQRERAETQMTLGQLVARLESLPPDLAVDGFSAPHSYRGYYCDLAFESAAGKITVRQALVVCRSAMGQVFEGYKGGDYTMGASTPIWIAEWGRCGKRIVALDDNGVLHLEEEHATAPAPPAGPACA